jgi:hypothetical protein
VTRNLNFLVEQGRKACKARDVRVSVGFRLDRVLSVEE